MYEFGQKCLRNNRVQFQIITKYAKNQRDIYSETHQ